MGLRSIDFALKHYQGIVSEFPVIIEFRHDYQEPTVYPKRSSLLRIDWLSDTRSQLIQK
ncbi:hypothetical protein PN499_16335 [Kamptonema animale CS-326]|jgi:hypothetical protein|uniref:hypothetical protein n=1 Tax=Kamptonema animale TaxID=92934 RepID=UPI00232AD058|nr:hypothetical protein [Kamptonema animale]MDB9512758.1 hypothetical protein [Kamptonema animale CS-326]